MRMTDKSVRAVKPTAARQQIADDLIKGLYLIVQPTGKKSWTARYRHGGVQRRVALGHYPVVGLAEARKLAGELLAQARAGADPAAEVRKTARTPDKTVAAVLDDYGNRKLTQLKAGALVKRELDRFVRAAWGGREIDAIARADVQALIDGIEKSGRIPTANRVLAYTKAFFSWCEDKGIIADNPAQKVKKAGKEESRDRVLSDDEIRWFWQACLNLGYPWGDLGRMLLLTGQRLNEIARLREDEIDGESIVLAKARTKNGRAHRLPLSDMAVDLLDDLPVIAGRPRWLFTTTGRGPVQGFHKGRAHLADEMERVAARERGEPVEIPRWTFHDLRRTAATGMADGGLWRQDIEAVLNHAPPKLEETYQRYNAAMRIRDALTRWEGILKRKLGHDNE